jgi:DNA-binding PadR family transcriptional regulator
LERDGLIEGRIEPSSQRGPARKVYHSTLAGRQALRAGVLHALAAPQRCYAPLQLGLANLPSLPQAEALAALQQYRNDLAARLGHVLARQKRQQPLPYFVDAMFSHSIALIEAELGWAEGFIAEMEERHAQD